MTTAEQIQLATDTLDKVVIPLVGLAIGWAAVHWGWKQQAEKQLARQDQVGAAARTAVGAVEQQLQGQRGQAKLDKAIDTTAAILAAHGVTMTDAEKQSIEATIEAEVGAMNRAIALASPPTVVDNAAPSTPPARQTASATLPPDTPGVSVAAHDPTASKPVGAGTPEARVAAGLQKGASA